MICSKRINIKNLKYFKYDFTQICHKSYKNRVSRMFPILSQSDNNYQSNKANTDSKCTSVNVRFRHILLFIFYKIYNK